MSTLKSNQNADLRKLLGNRTYVKATLAINAGSAATIKNTGAIIFSVDGVMLTKAALSAQSIAITHDQFGRDVTTQPSLAAYVQPVLTTVYYIIALNAGGTVATVQGGYAGQALTLNNQAFLSDGSMPVCPEGYTPVGVIKVALAGAATFTPATTALDAASVTATYFDVSTLPTAAL
jgi:hypothetical protein